MIAMWDKRAISFGKRHQLALDEKIVPSCVGTSASSIHVIAIAKSRGVVLFTFAGSRPSNQGAVSYTFTEQLPQLSPHLILDCVLYPML
jgi:hypothetical protein